MPQAIAFVASVITQALVAIAGPGQLALTVGNAIAGFASWRGIAQIALLAFSITRKPPKIGDPGAATSFRADAQAPRRFVLGQTGVGGVPVFGTTYYKNRLLAYMVALSAGQVEGLEAFYVDGEAVTLGTTTGPQWTGFDNAVTSGKYNNQMWMEYRTGDGSPYTNFGFGSALSPSNPAGLPEWSSAHLLRGVAHAAWIMHYNKDVYTQGIPQPLWVMRGQRCYDPRRDSTFPGGSGSHRRNNPATWEFTQSGPIIALKWAMGIYENGKLIGGLGLPWELLDADSFVNAANIAQSYGWTCNGVVTAEDDKPAVMAAICATFGGEFVPSSGRLGVTFGAAQTSTLTITDDDAAGPLTLNATRPYRDRKNAVKARYVEPLDRYSVRTIDAITDAGYVAEDNGEIRTLEIDLLLVDTATQCAQLAALKLAELREHRSLTGMFKPRLRMVREGQTVTVNSATLGINEKYRVMRRALNPDGSVSLDLRLETDSKYAWATGQSQTAPTPSPLIRFDPAQVSSPTNAEWDAEAVEIAAGGVLIPIIRVTGACSEPLASSIVVEFKPHYETEWRPFGEYPPSATNIEINGLTPATNYDVAISYRIANSDFVTPRFSILGIVTTASFTATAATSVDGISAVDLQDRLNRMAEEQISAHVRGDETRAYLDILGYVGGLPLGVTLANMTTQRLDGDTAIATTIALIGAKTIDGTAFVLDGTTVKVSPSETLATRLSTLSAADSSNSAAITTEQTARINGDNALASSLTTLTTTVGGHTATLSTYGASIDGLKVRYGVKLDVDGYITGFIANNDGVSSDFTIVTSKFYIVEPGSLSPRVLLSISGGVVKMPNVEVDTIKANSIYAASIVAGEITTNKISTNGVTQAGTATGSSSISISPFWADLLSVGITATGGRVIIQGGAYANPDNIGSTITVKLRVLRDGGVIFETTVAARDAFTTVICSDTPSAAYHTYTMQIYCSGAGSASYAAERTLVCTEYKR